MIKKSILCVLIFVITLCAFSGCSSINNDLTAIDYNNNVNVQDSIQINANLIDESLFEPYIVRYSMSFTEEFENLQKKNIFEVVRYSKGKYYTVSRLSDGSLFFMLFRKVNANTEAEQMILVDGFKVNELINKDDFKEVKVGTLKDTILELDSSTYDNDTYTIHRFTDKSVIMIKYQHNSNNNLIVSEIEEMSTENSVLSYLIPQDLDLISK